MFVILIYQCFFVLQSYAIALPFYSLLSSSVQLITRYHSFVQLDLFHSNAGKMLRNPGNIVVDQLQQNLTQMSQNQLACIFFIFWRHAHLPQFSCYFLFSITKTPINLGGRSIDIFNIDSQPYTSPQIPQTPTFPYNIKLMTQHEPSSDLSCKVYISNINKNIQQDDIRQKFNQYGVIKSLILKKKQNNVTYCFIQYETVAQASQAINEMNKKMFFDRELKVEEAKGGHKNYGGNGNRKPNRPRYPQDTRDRRHDRRRSYDRRSPSFSRSYDSYSSSSRSRSHSGRYSYDRRDRYRRDDRYERDDRYHYENDRYERDRVDRYDQRRHESRGGYRNEGEGYRRGQYGSSGRYYNQEGGRYRDRGENRERDRRERRDSRDRDRDRERDRDRDRRDNREYRDARQPRDTRERGYEMYDRPRREYDQRPQEKQRASYHQNPPSTGRYYPEDPTRQYEDRSTKQYRQNNPKDNYKDTRYQNYVKEPYESNPQGSYNYYQREQPRKKSYSNKDEPGSEHRQNSKEYPSRTNAYSRPESKRQESMNEKGY